MIDVMSTPALSGIHHLKVHVTDVRRSARWYQRTLGYEPVMEFVEGSRLVGYGMSHPNGGTVLTLRLDPEQAQKTAGWVYFEMGVPDTAALEGLAERLTALGVGHGPVVRTPIGWLLSGVFDPDGHEMRFYVSAPEEVVDSQHPIRIHDAGPGGWAERLTSIDLDESASLG
jgi:catechol 2,3-dioxygenase-like lactoylglutathione lyase family enzyme